MNIKELVKDNEGVLVGNTTEEKKINYNEEKYKKYNITGISYDSRVSGEDKIFFAAYGAGSDGNEYISKAIANGYKVIITDREKEELEEKYEVNFNELDENDCMIIKVNEVNEMLALVSERFYNFPAKELKLIGVTGTNGKTTTTSLIYECLKAFGKKSGLIGTMEIHYDTEIEVSKNTTPDAPKLQSVYRKMKDDGLEYNVMEVSSHSLALKRIFDEEFEIGVYTNLTEDHLDYHKTMENYRDAKLKLFEKSKRCILNLDTEYSNFYINETLKMNKDILLYGLFKDEKEIENYIKSLNDKYNKANLLIASDIKIDITGSKFKVRYITSSKKSEENIEEDIEEDIYVKTPGEFSVYNALSAIGTLLMLGFELKDIKNVLSNLDGIKGRFQTFMSNKGFGVTVDYAHTPDGLLNILKTAKEFVKGRIITVFGCGGDRDKLKRPIMGRIVMELSDVAIVTSDNPRTENPEEIIEDIEVGMKEFSKEYIKITDRYEATKKAIEIAKDGDLVIVAGKGHEDYQIIGKEKIHFSDIENVLRLINDNN